MTTCWMAPVDIDVVCHCSKVTYRWMLLDGRNMFGVNAYVTCALNAFHLAYIYSHILSNMRTDRNRLSKQMLQHAFIAPLGADSSHRSTQNWQLEPSFHVTVII
jgi:hypothetical protein